MRAEAQQPKDKVYAVFILNFARLIEWPPKETSGDFTIGVLDDSPLAFELKSVAKVKTVGKHRIKVEEYNAPSQIGSCNILFIPESKSAQVPKIIGRFPYNSMLIITEKEGLGKAGSNINFLIIDGKVRFELNERAIKGRGLKASAELQSVGILVE
jgi:hypothetical protein